MTGDLLMKCLLGIYLLTAATFAYEHNWPKAFYWISAAGITASVLSMK